MVVIGPTCRWPSSCGVRPSRIARRLPKHRHTLGVHRTLAQFRLTRSPRRRGRAASAACRDRASAGCVQCATIHMKFQMTQMRTSDGGACCCYSRLGGGVGRCAWGGWEDARQAGPWRERCRWLRANDIICQTLGRNRAPLRDFAQRDGRDSARRMPLARLSGNSSQARVSTAQQLELIQMMQHVTPCRLGYS
jgi:hypothetical protein